MDITRGTRFLDEPLRVTPRALTIAAAVVLIAVYFFPLWSLTMFAPQYEDGLRLFIYGYKLEGGNKGVDVREIDELNHYIGMKTLTAEDFTEFKWIPFAVGAFALLFLRVAVLGKLYQLLDVMMMYVYFGLFALGSFAYKLYVYGHNLDPTAAIKVKPFMPPMIGYKKIANFEIYSYPGWAAYALTAAAILLMAAFVIAVLHARQHLRGTAVRPELLGAAA